MSVLTCPEMPSSRVNPVAVTAGGATSDYEFGRSSGHTTIDKIEAQTQIEPGCQKNGLSNRSSSSRLLLRPQSTRSSYIESTYELSYGSLEDDESQTLSTQAFMGALVMLTQLVLGIMVTNQASKLLYATDKENEQLVRGKSFLPIALVCGLVAATDPACSLQYIISQFRIKVEIQAKKPPQAGGQEGDVEGGGYIFVFLHLIMEISTLIAQVWALTGLGSYFLRHHSFI